MNRRLVLNRCTNGISSTTRVTIAKKLLINNNIASQLHHAAQQHFYHKVIGMNHNINNNNNNNNNNSIHSSATTTTTTTRNIFTNRYSALLKSDENKKNKKDNATLKTTDKNNNKDLKDGEEEEEHNNNNNNNIKEEEENEEDDIVVDEEEDKFENFSNFEQLLAEEDDGEDHGVASSSSSSNVGSGGGGSGSSRNAPPGDNNGNNNNDGGEDEEGVNPIVTPEPEEPSTLMDRSSIPTPPFVEVIPCYKRPVFPGSIVILMIEDREFLRGMLEAAMERRLIGLFLLKDHKDREDGLKTVTRASQVEPVGVLALVTKLIPSRVGDGVLVSFTAIRRIKITGTVDKMPRLTVRVKDAELKPFDREDRNLKAYILSLTQALQELSALDPLHREQLQQCLQQMDTSDVARLADLVSLLTTVDADKLQDVLMTDDVIERTQKALILVKSEIETLKVRDKIRKSLDEKISAAQQKFYLNEQLKLIKKELGLETDEKDAIITKFKDRLKNLKPNETALKVINEELNKLSMLETASSEFHVVRNYMDWLTLLPWGQYNKENFDLRHAIKVLDEDHFGLKKIKDRILEFIAVGKLKGTVQGKILCFVGPPGVGKTSIGKSIARALQRDFYRFSVGGMDDVSEIKGHRRTYIGAMPGKLIQVMKLSKSSNPVIMIDEIDKMGKRNSDPSSALLEALDPEQNDAFIDHYLDVPFDLSKVLFICTANTLDTIQQPLLDRMEVLRLSGYILEEKVQIALRYLVPRLLDENGLNAKQIKMTTGMLRALIQNYCREAGIRNLQKHIERILRKVAFEIQTTKKNKKITITEAELEHYLGKPAFSTDRYYIAPPPGVVMGLAWTSMGGSTLYVETSIEPGKKGGSLKTTGQIGDVMKESSAIAYTFAKQFYNTLVPPEPLPPKKKKSKKDNEEEEEEEDEDDEPRMKKGFFDKSAIHMHIPEGATPKDGPSAGITMVTSLLSLALNKPVKQNLSMTGELTLTGKVLAIGGVKEKIIAARRSGVREVILPISNKKDWTELDHEIRDGITVHFADYYSDVYKVAFEYDEALNEAEIEQDKKKSNILELSVDK